MQTVLAEIAEKEKALVAKIGNGVRKYGTYIISGPMKTVPNSQQIDCPVCSTVGEQHKMLLRAEQAESVEEPMLWRMCTNCGFNYPGRWDVSGPRTLKLILERHAQADKMAFDLGL